MVQFHGIQKQEAVEWCKGEDWLINQIGFLIEDTKEHLLIASKFNPQETDNRFSGLQKIPKTWVRKRKEIKL